MGHCDPARLVRAFEACAAAPSDLPSVAFVDGCREIGHIVSLLGPGFSIASADINDKCRILSARLDEAAAASPPAAAAAPAAAPAGRPTLQRLVRAEVAAGTAATNSAQHASAARTVLRLLWMIDFIAVLFEGLAAAPADSLTAVARAAYHTALEPHHTLLVKLTAKAAMSFLPSRERFLQALAAGGGADGAAGGGRAQAQGGVPAGAPAAVAAVAAQPQQQPQPQQSQQPLQQPLQQPQQPQQPLAAAEGGHAPAAPAGVGGASAPATPAQAVTATLARLPSVLAPVRAELWRFYTELALTDLT